MPEEAELRLHRACFTGHRPEKLDRPEAEVIAGLEREILKAISDGFTTFISGMARGVDIWAAEIVLRLRSEGHGSVSSVQVLMRALRRTGARNGRTATKRLLRRQIS